MPDSINNLLEQQQKFTDLFNKIYTPELLRMQQTCSELTKQIQFPVSDALLNLSEASALLRESTQSFQTDKFLSEWNRAMEISRQLTQNMSSVWEKVDIDRFTFIAQQLTLPTEALENFSRSLSLLQSECIISNLYDTIQSMPDSVWDTLLEEEGYSKEEIQIELEGMKTKEFRITDVKGLTPDQVTEKMWVWLWGNFPKIAVILLVWILTVGKMGEVNSAIDFFLPIAQEAIVRIQGNKDKFFIKTDSAKLYVEANSHSTVITRILYAEEVIQIDSVKMWNKVIYISPNGEEITGWIAKRNLMPYRDYQFNSDNLYDMESKIVFEPEEDYKEEIKECDCSATNARVEGVSAGNIANYTLLR